MKHLLTSLLLATTIACGGGAASGPNNDTLARPPGTELDKEACGPAPGAPATQCSDGSIGGNTGRCLVMADGQPGWEMRACPVDTEGGDENIEGGLSGEGVGEDAGSGGLGSGQ